MWVAVVVKSLIWTQQQQKRILEDRNLLLWKHHVLIRTLLSVKSLRIDTLAENPTIQALFRQQMYDPI